MLFRKDKRQISLAGLAIALALVVTTVFGETAFAQSAEFRCPPVGTKLKYSSGAQIESLGSGGELVCRFKDLGTLKTEDRLLGAFLPTAKVVKDNFAQFRSLNPLQVRKKISWQGSGASNLGSGGDWTFDVSIERYEVVTTPVGNIPAFVVLQVERTFSNNGRWERRWWYSPLIGHNVKFEFQTVHGNPPPNYPKNFELVEVRTP